LAEIDNATTTLTDNVAEIDLLSRDIFLETSDDGVEVGITDNTPPPGTLVPFPPNIVDVYICVPDNSLYSLKVWLM
jgi:hypothetical protein